MKKVLQQLLFIVFLSFFVISCEKGEEQFPIPKSTEKALIKFMEGGNIVNLALDITTGFEAIDVVEIRRDATGPGDLQKTQTVKIEKSNSVLSELGQREVFEMPSSVYEANPDNPFDGQAWTVTFEPGEAVKFLKLNINTTALAALGARLGLGFKLVSAPGAQISAELNQTAVEIGAKNAWDGVYMVKYRFFHPTNAALTGSGIIPEWDFPSSGPTSIDWDFATVFINFSTGGLTYFGDAGGPSLQVRITVNPDNTVTLTNVGSRAIPLAFPPLVVPAGVTNKYDPAAKTFYTAYTWTPAGAGTREKYDTLIYVRPR